MSQQRKGRGKKAFHVKCQEIMGSYSVTQRKLASVVNSFIAPLPNASTETALTVAFGSNFPARIDYSQENSQTSKQRGNRTVVSHGKCRIMPFTRSVS